ncbi:MAG: TIGR03364 family FAD-dependent oxidoreductase [Saprospiraceae bacterium]
MKKIGHAEVAVIGSGIMGLAIAYEAAKKGKKVTVFERHSYPIGASVRNFGTIWPIGQKMENYDRAMRSRAVWLELSEKAQIHIDQTGSLHLAYFQDEMDVFEEFIENTNGAYQANIISPNAVKKYSNAAVSKGLKGALYSQSEMTVSSPKAIMQIIRYLKEQFQVQFEFDVFITNIKMPVIESSNRFWTAEKIFVCTGSDFETLYPEIYANAGLIKCKLQMLNTVAQPQDWRLGAVLCGGLTLRHYASFADCKSVNKVSERYNAEEPLLAKYGIHIILSQNSDGQLIIGDSHEYGQTLSPFDNEEVNELILTYLKKFAGFPEPKIKERWHGIYLKSNDQTEYVSHPELGVTIVNGLGGAGMTLSFGLAQELIQF